MFSSISCHDSYESGVSRLFFFRDVACFLACLFPFWWGSHFARVGQSPIVMEYGQPSGGKCLQGNLWYSPPASMTCH